MDIFAAQPCPDPGPPDLEDWARSLIADPARYCATDREAGIVASLLAELEAGR